MRRFFLGIVIASMTAAAPMSALGGDREVAVISALKKQQSTGALKGFDLDLSVKDGKVTLTGNVANQEQLNTVLNAARNASGVRFVENLLTVDGESVMTGTGATPASANAPESSVTARDADITDRIIGQLSSEKQSGKLRHFELDVSTVSGEVWLRGYVATPDQKQRVLSVAQRTAGVRKVIDDITVAGESGVRTASGQSSSMPVVGSGVPQPFAPSMLASQMMDSGMPAPVPMQGVSSYAGGAPRYDQPHMPSYSWPSYAAYPNYAAVTYPKQYSASAWPYIGPFYPYPQVPLGWRKVTLEWDDGLWYLDFSSKR